MSTSTERTQNEKFPATSPRSIDSMAWFYEERKGLCIVAQTHHHQLNSILTRQVTVPWKTLCTAVDRYRRANAKRRAR